MLFTESNSSKIMIESGFQSFLFENDFKALFPELFLIISTLCLLIYGVVLATDKRLVNHSCTTLQPLLLQNMSWLSLLCIVYALALLENSYFVHGIVLYGSIILDDFTLFFKGLVLLGAFFSILISLEYFKGENINYFESIILIMVSICSMLFLISSGDFITMYLAIELQSFCFYILAASKRNSEFSTEAGLKYFLLGAFSSGLLLFGCSLIYGFTGITTFSEVGKLLTLAFAEATIRETAGFAALELGMIFIIVGFLFKLTAAPFHMWAPDVYEGAPTSVTAFFSIVPKVSVLAVFMRLFLDCFFDLMLPWQKIIIFASLASMVVGALAALSQNRIKRFLAFSSVGHVGYLLIGFCCGTMEGVQSLLIYLVVYVIMTLTLFALILSPVERNRLYSVQRVKYITDFAQLGNTNPVLAFTLTVTMFSIAGIPPLAGFYSKASLFFAAMSSGMYLLAVVGVLTSVLSCFYYIRLVKIMYFELPKHYQASKQPLLLGFGQKLPLLQDKQIFSRISKENSITLGITLLFILFFLLFPAPLYLATHHAALSLCV